MGDNKWFDRLLRRPARGPPPPPPVVIPPEVELEADLERARIHYDCLRLMVADLQGAPRTRLLCPAAYPAAFRHGVEASPGILAPPSDEAGLLKLFPSLADINCGSLLLRPAPGTLHDLREAEPGRRVGQVLCEPCWVQDERPLAAGPRALARCQLDRLAQLGFTLCSGFQAEFMVVKASRNSSASKRLLGNTNNCCYKCVGIPPLEKNNPDVQVIALEDAGYGSQAKLGSRRCSVTSQPLYSSQSLSEWEPLLLDIQDNLQRADIPVSTIDAKEGACQFQVSTLPVFGVTAADGSFVMKQIIRETCAARGLDAIFTPKPCSDEFQMCNGLHFNHSLWTTDEKTNVCGVPLDDRPSSTVNNRVSAEMADMSEVAKYWLAGQIHHARSLTLLYNPTDNCYQRLQGLNSDSPSWGMDDRFSIFRVKPRSSHSTFIANRLPSSAANPYLVMAATIAAGIDGIVNRLYLPPPLPTKNEAFLASVHHRKASSLNQGRSAPTAKPGLWPTCVAEAVKCFKQDQVIVEALGTEFAQWYTNVLSAESKQPT